MPDNARASRAYMSEWPTATRGVVTVGALGAVAVMISPITPGMDGAIIFGCSVSIDDVSELADDPSP